MDPKSTDETSENRRSLIKAGLTLLGASAVLAIAPGWLQAAAYAGGSEGLEKTKLTLGFVPLTDCAPLVVALEKGMFRKYGLDVTLTKDMSWGSIRDKVASGAYDGGHMLAPMPLATTLGLGGIKKPTITALSLDLNGNAITVSNALYARMLQADPGGVKQWPMSARALKLVIDEEKRAVEDRYTFATVYPYSTHHYELRYWLAAGGINPDTDLRLITIPPPYMPAYLRSGEISGYCAGEPWNEFAVLSESGRALITNYEIWNNNPEKVLGVNLEWAEKHPHTHQALIMALLESAQWLDKPENRMEAVEMIAKPAYVHIQTNIIKMSMLGSFQYQSKGDLHPLPDFNVFSRYAANFPWRSHAIWFITQMYRWGQIEEPLAIKTIAETVYRPDIYRQAAKAVGIATPLADYKNEGEHSGPWTLTEATAPIAMGADHFLDARHFNPADPIGYLEGFSIKQMRTPMESLRKLNS